MGSILSSFFGGSYGQDDSSSSEPSRFVSFNSSARWQLHFNSVKDSSQLMVIDFAASWCGPCKFMEPAVRDMAARFTDVEFAKIDVNQLPDVAKDFRVEAMPTFVLVKKGNEVDRVVGAKKDELEKKIKTHRAS